MTDYQELARHWQAMRALAPDLLDPITDVAGVQRAAEALFALDEAMEAAGLSRPHPLDDLADLVVRRIVAYEDEHYGVGDGDPASMLAFILEQREMTPERLAEETGMERATVDALLSGELEFTVNHARQLSTHFGCNAAVFL